MREALSALAYTEASPATRGSTLCMLTIGTLGQRSQFGEMELGSVRLNLEGEIVRLCWVELQNIFESVTLDAFTVLPNRLCGIIHLDGELQDLHRIVRAFTRASTLQIHSARDAEIGGIWEKTFETYVIRSRDELVRLRCLLLTGGTLL